MQSYTINFKSSSRYKFDRRKIRSYLQETLASKQVPVGVSLNIVFVGARKMKSIANTYKNENIALPVLSFSYLHDKENDERLMGEIFMCYPQVVLLAAERGKKVDDMIFRLAEHGIDNIVRK